MNHQARNKLNSIWIGALGVVLFIGLIVPSFSVASRNRARDARIQADLSQFRTIAGFIYEDEEGGSYANLDCNYQGIYEKEIKALCKDIEQQSGTPPVIHATEEDYCAYAPLVIQRGAYLCVDAAGVFRKTYIDPGGQTYCDGNTFVCPLEEGVPPSFLAEDDQKEDLVFPISIGIGLVLSFLATLWIRVRRRKARSAQERSGVLIKEVKACPENSIAVISFVALVMILVTTVQLSYTLDLIVRGLFTLLYVVVIWFSIASLFCRGRRNKIIGAIILLMLLGDTFLILVSLRGA